MSTINMQALMGQYNSEQTVAVEPGVYNLQIESAAVRDDRITPVYRVVGGPNAGQKVMAGQLIFTDKASWSAIKNLKAFGVNPADYSTLEEIAAVLPGRIVEVTLGVREWNGEDRNEFKPGTPKLVSMGTADGTPAGVPTAAAPPAPAAPAAPPETNGASEAAPPAPPF